MKFLDVMVLSSSLAFILYLVATLGIGLRTEIGLSIAALVFVVVGGIGLIGFEEFMRKLSSKPRAKRINVKQKSEYNRRMAQLKAESDFNAERSRKKKIRKHWQKIAKQDVVGIRGAKKIKGDGISPSQKWFK